LYGRDGAVKPWNKNETSVPRRFPAQVRPQINGGYVAERRERIDRI
jgi:hypothetical protein